MEIIVLRRSCRACDIAREWGVEENELIEINGLEYAATLPAGMSLLLPGKSSPPGGEKEIYLALGKGHEGAAENASFLAAKFAPEDKAADSSAFADFALSRGAVPVYSLTARGDLPSLRQLICGEDKSAAFLEPLTESLSAAGYRALGLDISRLLPFDKNTFTAFAHEAAKAAHEKGLWLICTLPLHREEEKYQRRCAAYDIAALGEIADRLILDSGILAAAEDVGSGLEYARSFVPGGRLLLGIHEAARIERGTETELISARCARNIAVAAKAQIIRRGKGEPAEFSYRDPAGLLCRVCCGDALWARSLCELTEKYSLAGLARLSSGERGVAQSLFGTYFSFRETL